MNNKPFYTQEQLEKIQNVFSKFHYHDEIKVNQKTGKIKAMWIGDFHKSKNTILYAPTLYYYPIWGNSRFWEIAEWELKTLGCFQEFTEISAIR